VPALGGDEELAGLRDPLDPADEFRVLEALEIVDHEEYSVGPQEVFDISALPVQLL
jgi:hypothetical protein